MNMMLALPEIVLAACGLAILIVGVLTKKEGFSLCTMLVLGAFGLTAALVIGGDNGTAYSGIFVSDAFSRFAKVLILAGGALTAIL